MLKYIFIVTIMAGELAAVEQAWEEHLGYTTVHRGRISTELAGLWDASAMAGRHFLIMQPASGAPVYVRFIEAPDSGAPAPMLSWGWNATELLVQDPDALAGRLAATPFRIIGPPADLYDTPDAPRAMQALGPARELLYFTRIIPSGTRLQLSGANTEVDRLFIMVVGGPSMPALVEFYGQRLGMPIRDLGAWRISVLAEAHGLPSDTTFPLAVAEFPRDYLIELDEYPASATPRPVRPGELPPGLAMVSLIAEDLDRLELRWRRPPAAVAEFPYSGRRSGVAVGPAGEWLEFVEELLPDASP